MSSNQLVLLNSLIAQQKSALSQLRALSQLPESSTHLVYSKQT
ncbi:hypothetical protein [Legionella sp. PATHC039]|nr:MULTISPECIES: hypothetical protein [Legionella]MCW8396287.1 hypothetical protein [Legionella sp. PATHC039]